jgi:hypothetical protein
MLPEKVWARPTDGQLPHPALRGTLRECTPPTWTLVARRPLPPCASLPQPRADLTGSCRGLFELCEQRPV